ncbi:hypothetical protein [Mesorhizobium sp. KR1-2]|uniref:hypothetical protein n=1 Tax=Mesorhizobium sp. KR1-2 TaxID=3156609 RepID=UPI0032B4FD32
MSTSLETIRAAIRHRMLEIAGIGVIHAYERYAAREKEFAELYMYGQADQPKRLLGWHIHRVATREFAYSSLQNRVEIDFAIRGWMAIEDARQTEILMDGLVEKLRAAWRRDPSFNGIFNAPITDGQPFGLQLVESQPYMLGGVLCHGVRLSFTGGLLLSIEDDPAEWDDFARFAAEWPTPPTASDLVNLPIQEPEP